MGTYLCIINLARTEQRIEGIISGDEETSKVDKERAGDVEEYQEEVEAEETKDDVNLGDRGLLLEVVQGRILGELERFVSPRPSQR
jgi:hypothetical protein